jgi:hypothetical protein
VVAASDAADGFDLEGLVCSETVAVRSNLPAGHSKTAALPFDKLYRRDIKYYLGTRGTADLP